MKEHGLHWPLACDKDPAEGTSGGHEIGHASGPAACKLGGAEVERRGGSWPSSGSVGSSRKVPLTRRSIAKSLTTSGHRLWRPLVCPEAVSGSLISGESVELLRFSPELAAVETGSIEDCHPRDAL
jgi:hypothetical protein